MIRVDVKAWNRSGDGRRHYSVLHGKNALNEVVHILLCAGGSVIATNETDTDYTTYVRWRGWEVTLVERRS